MQITLPKINPISVVKFIVSGIVGLGTRSIVNSVIANNTPEPETYTQKVTTNAAGTVMGFMAAERTRRWTDAKIDAIVSGYHKAAAEAEAKQEQKNT